MPQGKLSSLARLVHAAVCVGLGCTVLSSQVLAQSTFIDDAQRTVQLPANVSRVFAAGAPADVLLYTLVPEMLVGRNQVPSPAALEFVPLAFRTPVPIANLPNVDDDKADAELLALKPDVYVDYGDVTPDYIASVNNVQERTGIPGIILDGAMERIPATYRKLGAALGVKARGDLLAAHAERILAKYKGVLQKAGTAPRVYLACNADGTIPCLEGERSGEVARILGAINVAGTTGGPAKRPTVEDIKTWNPEAIIATSQAAADRMRSDVSWQALPAIMKGRLYAPPTLPFNWGPRPPSVNRLLGLMWLAHVLSGAQVDAAFVEDARAFFTDFYQVTPTDAQLQSLLGG